MRIKRFKISVFYTVYTVLVIVALATLVFFAKRLWVYLYDYEHSLPKYVAEDVFKEYYSPCDFALLSEKSGVDISEYENTEYFEEYMQAKTVGKEITYHEVSTGLGKVKKYVVKAGDEKISDFTLKKSGKKSKEGFDLFELDKINLVYSADESITFSVIKGGSVKLNGHKLDLSKCTIVEDNIETFSHGHMLEGSGAQPITYATYRISNLFLSPEVSSFDRNGQKSVLVLDKGTGIYKEEINYDEELREKKMQVSKDGAEVYLRYMTRDASEYMLGLYFDRESEIYKKVRISDTKWFAYHIGYEFLDSSISEFYAYSEDTFSCRYTCTHAIMLSPTQVHEFPIDITFYFREVGENTLIYDLVSNN